MICLFLFLQDFLKVFAYLSLIKAPLVAHNGAMIILKDKIISYTIPTDLVYDICSYCDDLDWNIYDGDNWYSTNQYFKDHAIEESYIGKVSTKIGLEDIKKIQTIHKIVCIGSLIMSLRI
nr:HAD hydrolase family protein [Catenibacterium sp. co_0103]